MSVSEASEFKQVFSANPLYKLITNVETRIIWEKVGNYDCPVTINELEFESSYVVSPYSALVLYSKQELKKLPAFFQILELILGPISLLLRYIKINKMVAINNWLLSTNIYPDLDPDLFLRLGERYRQEYKDHFIIFRSLNFRSNEKLIHKLLANGFTLIPSRQVYIFDFKADAIFERGNNRHDQRLLKKNVYEMRSGDSFGIEDFRRAEELYRFLYVDKYSIYNPQFTADYMKLCHDTQRMIFFGFYSKEGVMEGVVGFFKVGKIITAPVVGYNIHLPQSAGLYRILMAQTLKYAATNDFLLNLSSGASLFKILRGGRAYTEYSAVSLSGLGLGRRIGFRIIQAILFVLILPLLKVFKL